MPDICSIQPPISKAAQELEVLLSTFDLPAAFPSTAFVVFDLTAAGLKGSMTSYLYMMLRAKQKSEDHPGQFERIAESYGVESLKHPRRLLFWPFLR